MIRAKSTAMRTHHVDGILCLEAGILHLSFVHFALEALLFLGGLQQPITHEREDVAALRPFHGEIYDTVALA